MGRGRGLGADTDEHKYPLDTKGVQTYTSCFSWTHPSGSWVVVEQIRYQGKGRGLCPTPLISVFLYRAKSVACVGTLMTMPSMISPHAASLWSVTCWSLEIAGSCLHPARMPRCPRTPALPTLTANPGPKSNAASSTAQPSQLAMLMYGSGAGWSLDLAWRCHQPRAWVSGAQGPTCIHKNGLLFGGC